MKLPRDVSASDLIKFLRNLGHSVTRQSGSYIRLTSQLRGEHHITIPQTTTQLRSERSRQL